jgi:hypothetical protein
VSIDIPIRLECETCGYDLEADIKWYTGTDYNRRGYYIAVKPCEYCEEARREVELAAIEKGRDNETRKDC